MRVTFRKVLLFIISIITAAVCFAFSAGALDETGKCGDDVYWNYSEETGTLVISGTGDMSDAYHSSSPFFGSGIKTVIIDDGVTSIGDYMFYNCYSLEKVIIGDGVKNIGMAAFSFCYGLTDVVMGNGVTVIGDSAFSVCDGLESITFPDGVKTVGESAFYGCERLKALSVPDSVENIGTYAFFECTSLAAVTVGNGVKNIGEYAFGSCASLEEIEIPDSVIAIGDGCFSECSGLKKAIIGDGVIAIGESAFFGCSCIEQVIIGDAVTVIGRSAFLDCGLLKTVKLGASVTEISESAFVDCFSLVSIDLPESLKVIGHSAFYSCYGLESVTGGEGLTVLEDAAFYGCESLSDISLSGKVTTVGDCAFYDCRKLLSIKLPDSVNEIGEEVFGENRDVCIYCNKKSYAASYATENNFRYVYLDGTDAESIVSGSFNNCNWSFDKRTGVLEFSGKGVIPDFTSVSAPWLEYSYCITCVKISEGITKIGRRAFYNIGGLKNITIPDSVTDIGDEAFYGCRRLENMTVGKNLKYVGQAAFHYRNGGGEEAAGIKNLFIPDTNVIFSINFSYDSGREGLSPYNFISGAENLYIGNVRTTDLVIPEGITFVGSYLLGKCMWLESVIIPDSVTEIGEYAFYDCDSLVNARFGSGVTFIRNGAFYDCDGLTNVDLCSDVTTVGNDAFYGCDSLKEITVPHSVTDLGLSAFAYCSNLERVTFGLDEKNCSGIKCAPQLVGTKVKELVLPASVETVGKNVMPETIEKVTVYNSGCMISSSCGLDSGAVIAGFRGSTAQAYALDKGMSFIDVEQEHEHNYKHIPGGDYCFFGRCYCGKERATPHSYNLTETVSATCTENGIKIFSCSCGDSYSEAVKATGHKAVTDRPVSATCTEAGFTEGSHCSECKEVIVAPVKIPATGHRTGACFVIKASESEDGRAVTVCSVCASEIKESKIPSVACVKLSAEKYVYNGKVITPDVTVKDSAGKTLTVKNDYTVSYSSGRKNVGRYTVTVRFKGKYSGTEKLSFTVIPQTPTSVKVSSVGETSLKLSWKAVEGAAGYRVYKYNPSLKKYQSVAFVEGKTSFTVFSLNPGTEYKFKVRAYAEPDDESTLWSGYSSEVSTVTKLPSVAVTKLTAGSKQLTATWKTVSGVTGYEVVYSTSKSFTKKTTKTVTIKKAKTKKTTIKKLTKGKKYFVKVRAYKTVSGKKIYGAWSTVKNAKVK